MFKLLPQPHRHLLYGKLKNTTQRSNQQLTAPLNPSNVSVSNSVGKVIPHTSLGYQETPCILGRSTPRYFELQWMNCGRSSGMSNSGSRWKFTEQIMIRVRISLVPHTQCSNMNNDKKLGSGQSLATEYTGRSGS